MRLRKLCEGFIEARFLARPNRFTLLLERGGRKLGAFLPNTGRLEEHLVEGSVFHLTPSPTGRLAYRVVSTQYQGAYVCLDASRIGGVAKALIREEACGARPLEVKTCTLCHNGVALFPDAPSGSASLGLDRLAALASRGQAVSMIFVVPHAGAAAFIPNLHVDRRFAARFLDTVGDTGVFADGDGASPGIDIRAFSLAMTDPVTVDLDSVRELEIDRDKARTHTTNSGSYVLVLGNARTRRLKVGSLGTLTFWSGYYAYVGSALGSLDSRVGRHLRRRKKRFWHVDYLTPEPMPVEKVFPVRRKDRIEGALAARIGETSDGSVEGFGASDSEEASHLFYFKRPPYRLRAFIDVILDFRTFTELSEAAPR